MTRPAFQETAQLRKPLSLGGQLDPVPARHLKSAIEHGFRRLLLEAGADENLSNFEQVLHLFGAHQLEGARVDARSDQVAIEMKWGDRDGVATLPHADGPQPVAAVVLGAIRAPLAAGNGLLCLTR